MAIFVFHTSVQNNEDWLFKQMEKQQQKQQQPKTHRNFLS